MPIRGLPYSDEQLFTTVNAVLPVWALLCVAPRWRFTLPIVTLTATCFAVLYVLLMINSIIEEGAPEFFTYQGVSKLLSTRSVVLPAWVHYVVFDLWAGRWEANDAQQHGVPQVIMAVPLFFTLMLGPAGLLMYLLFIRPWFRLRAQPPTDALKEE